MRTFKMYLVFILSAALLSGCCGYGREELHNELLKLYNNERASKNLTALNLMEIYHAEQCLMLKIVAKYPENNIGYLKDDFCYIFAKLPNISQMKTKEIFDALKEVHDENTNDDKNIKNTSTKLGFTHLELHKLDEFGEPIVVNFFVAIYNNPECISKPIIEEIVDEVYDVENVADEITQFE